MLVLVCRQTRRVVGMDGGFAVWPEQAAISCIWGVRRRDGRRPPLPLRRGLEALWLAPCVAVGAFVIGSPCGLASLAVGDAVGARGRCPLLEWTGAPGRGSFSIGGARWLRLEAAGLCKYLPAGALRCWRIPFSSLWSGWLAE
ncbi:hypothetical protein NDU88_005590 [Pleurodeles waltl]|uniref:Uncharacterized protein n=1 Tax=Pleurodeles waltl TaxID=8319 RepID=A0AAV7X1N6_PLEWA|nr:hypothetical protein NDU88_005590 [Pleurodeles waltl]